MKSCIQVAFYYTGAMENILVVNEHNYILILKKHR